VLAQPPPIACQRPIRGQRAGVVPDDDARRHPRLGRGREVGIGAQPEHQVIDLTKRAEADSRAVEPPGDRLSATGTGTGDCRASRSCRASLTTRNPPPGRPSPRHSKAAAAAWRARTSTIRPVVVRLRRSIGRRLPAPPFRRSHGSSTSTTASWTPTARARHCTLAPSAAARDRGLVI